MSFRNREQSRHILRCIHKFGHFHQGILWSSDSETSSETSLQLSMFVYQEELKEMGCHGRDRTQETLFFLTIETSYS